MALKRHIIHRTCRSLLRYFKFIDNTSASANMVDMKLGVCCFLKRAAKGGSIAASGVRVHYLETSHRYL